MFILSLPLTTLTTCLAKYSLCQVQTDGNNSSVLAPGQQGARNLELLGFPLYTPQGIRIIQNALDNNRAFTPTAGPFAGQRLIVLPDGRILRAEIENLVFVGTTNTPAMRIIAHIFNNGTWTPVHFTNHANQAYLRLPLGILLQPQLQTLRFWQAILNSERNLLITTRYTPQGTDTLDADEIARLNFLTGRLPQFNNLISLIERLQQN